MKCTQTLSQLPVCQSPTQWLLLYGVPGVGKTHLARTLSSERGCELLEADSLRNLALSQGAGRSDRALELGTTEAYRLYGAARSENIWRGLESVRAALLQWVIEYLQNHPAGGIAEAAFLEPATLAAWGQPCLLTCLPQRLHARRFFSHRPWRPAQLDSFVVARRLQRLLLAEARQLDLPVVCTVDERHALQQLDRLF